MDEHDVQLLLQDTPFAERSANFLLRAKPAIRLNRRIAEDKSIPVGASKLGGRPDLPPGFAWPGRDGMPFAFLTQIKLAAVAPADVDHLLPRTGLLSFFYGIAHPASGFDPHDRGSWLVMHHDEGDVPVLSRTDPPPALVEISDAWGPLHDGLFTACALEASHDLTLPDPYSEQGYELTDGHAAVYDEVVEALRRSEEQPLHQLLGYPALVQNEMELECQLASHGVFCGDATWQSDPRAADLMPGASDWRLLLQIDTDMEAGLEWGDEARLYYWIQKQALARHDFTNVWFVYQSL